MYHFFLKRSFFCTFSADIVYAENGPSVELPAGVIAFFLGKRLVIHTGDSRASERANQKKTLGFVSRFARWQAEAVMGDSPLVKPEILPFEEMPASAISAYEESWSNHMRSLEHTFTHAK